MQVMVKVATAILVVITLSSTVHGSLTIGGMDYYQSGPSEDLEASFGPSFSAPVNPTVNNYYGLVQVTVGHYGQALDDYYSDAFYVFADGNFDPISPFHDSRYYQLAFNAFGPVDGSPGSPTPSSQLAKNHVVYDLDGDTEVAPGYVPTYRADHTYSFVLDTARVTEGTLHFSVANGIFSDNTGYYDIHIQQLSVVPEPGTITIWGSFVALGILGGRRRKR